jgi:dTDP-N-acetylfucosamine:lipid II N-acetylfucosaminyltransferase
LDTFLPLTEYNKIIRSCGIVIMNHHRQQAVGNILASILLGSKVYLSEKNTILQYLRGIGIFVFSIERDLKPHFPEALNNLTEFEINHNREILHREIALDNVVSKLRVSMKEFSHI